MERWVLVTLALTALTPSGRSQELDFLVSPGELARAHSDLSGLKNCSSCHDSGSGLSPEKCLACHEELSTRIQAARGFHARKKENCIECHHDHQGVDFQIIQWIPSELDHSETGYPLVGFHAEVEDCRECHNESRSPSRQKTKTYFLNDTRCVACHEDIHKGQLGDDCRKCHTVDVKFDKVRFDHGQTAYPLIGAHKRVACGKCHLNKQWKGLRFSDCTDCHDDIHQPSLGDDCQRCHHSESWSVSTFNHEQTRYPLRGMHVDVTCTQCHVEKQLTGLAFSTCVDCHSKDPHVGQFENDCSWCHVVAGFDKTIFDHAKSSYPLTGKHGNVKCSECHHLEQAAFPNGPAEAVRYRPIDTLCASCHEDIHLGQFKKACSDCHITAGFARALVQFDHDVDSRFRLQGKHTDVVCEKCHKQERAVFPLGEGTARRFLPLPEYCFGCHNNVHDPDWWRFSVNHLETDCQRCHSPETFVPATFDHNRTTFALTGKHTSLTCDRCHDIARWKDKDFILFQKLSADCVDCHRSPHLKGMKQCTSCHTSENWRVRAW